MATEIQNSRWGWETRRPSDPASAFVWTTWVDGWDPLQDQSLPCVWTNHAWTCHGTPKCGVADLEAKEQQATWPADACTPKGRTHPLCFVVTAFLYDRKTKHILLEDCGGYSLKREHHYCSRTVVGTPWRLTDRDGAFEAQQEDGLVGKWGRHITLATTAL